MNFSLRPRTESRSPSAGGPDCPAPNLQGLWPKGSRSIDRVYEAVRRIGTNALPTLLRMLRAKDSALKVKLMDLVKRQHYFRIEYTPADELNYRACSAFGVLRAKAQSAAPALIRIYEQNISPASQFYVSRGPKLDTFTGRFAQLLPPKRPGAEGIELARAMLAAMGVTEERLRGNAERN